jgi:coniferyl-aldehyde dehydrogenase
MAQLHQVMQLAPAVADQRMRDVLDRQRAAFNREGYVSAEVRIDRLTRLLALTVEHQDFIVDTMRADFGGERSREATLLGELLPTVQGIKQARKALRRWMRPQCRRINVPFGLLGGRAEVVHTPKGVVGIIAPWNLPFGLTIAPLTAALAAGNRAMVKPSQYTPQTSALCADLLGGEDETCKILAQGFVLSRSRREPEFFRDRWRHTIKAQFVMAEAVNVLRFIG